jgi:hypothetical protein
MVDGERMMMRNTFWVFIGLVTGAGVAAAISLSVGFQPGAVLPVVFWSVIVIGLVIRFVRHTFGHRATPITESLASTAETWEELHLGRSQGPKHSMSPAHSPSDFADEMRMPEADATEDRR